MTPAELKELAQTMRELGVTHLKTDKYELNVELKPPPSVVIEDKDQKEIPHVVQQLVGIMKMSDKELAENLFPDNEAPGFVSEPYEL